MIQKLSGKTFSTEVALGPALVICVLSFSAITGGCQSKSDNASTTPDSSVTVGDESQLIMFYTRLDGNEEIYLMDETGANQRNLTKNTAADLIPSWSPESGKIAFVSDRDGSSDVFVMNVDGTGVVNLTNNPAWDSEYSWSPDGKFIAFVSVRDGNREIYIVAIDGSVPIRLTDWRGPDDAIVWFPDSKRIRYSSVKGGKGWIWTMNLDGSDKRLLEDIDYFDRGPIVSKDGKNLAFARETEGDLEVYVTDLFGKDKTRLTSDAKLSGFADWTPEDRMILFPSNVNRRGSIKWFDIGIQETTVIATFDNIVYSVSLSPDKKKILFAQSGPEGGSEVYIMNVDGSNVKQLTSHGLSAGAPSWILVDSGTADSGDSE